MNYRLLSSFCIFFPIANLCNLLVVSAHCRFRRGSESYHTLGSGFWMFPGPQVVECFGGFGFVVWFEGFQRWRFQRFAGESLEVHDFLGGFGGCEGSGGIEWFRRHGFWRWWFQRIRGLRGFRRSRFQRQLWDLLSISIPIGSGVQIGFPEGFWRYWKYHKLFIWKVWRFGCQGSGHIGHWRYCIWKVSNTRGATHTVFKMHRINAISPKIQSFDEQDATLLLGMPSELASKMKLCTWWIQSCDTHWDPSLLFP